MKNGSKRLLMYLALLLGASGVVGYYFGVLPFSTTLQVNTYPDNGPIGGFDNSMQIKYRSGAAKHCIEGGSICVKISPYKSNRDFNTYLNGKLIRVTTAGNKFYVDSARLADSRYQRYEAFSGDSGFPMTIHETLSGLELHPSTVPPFTGSRPVTVYTWNQVGISELNWRGVIIELEGASESRRITSVGAVDEKDSLWLVQGDARFVQFDGSEFTGGCAGCSKMKLNLVIAFNDPAIKRDSDGDGIFDKEDACPDESGSSLNNGCPVPPAPPVPESQGFDWAISLVWDTLLNLFAFLSPPLSITGEINPVAGTAQTYYIEVVAPEPDSECQDDGFCEAYYGMWGLKDKDKNTITKGNPIRLTNGTYSTTVTIQIPRSVDKYILVGAITEINRTYDGKWIIGEEHVVAYEPYNIVTKAPIPSIEPVSHGFSVVDEFLNNIRSILCSKWGWFCG